MMRLRHELTIEGPICKWSSDRDPLHSILHMAFYYKIFLAAQTYIYSESESAFEAEQAVHCKDWAQKI